MTTTYMYTKALLLCSALGLIAVGCSSEAVEETSDQFATATAWAKTLECHGLTIDVDTNSRRHLQGVIHDPHATDYLSAHPGGGNVGKKNEKGEIILSGFARTGVFGAGDFSGFRQSCFCVRDSNDAVAYVERSGSDVKVRLVTSASGQEVETANWVFRDCH